MSIEKIPSSLRDSLKCPDLMDVMVNFKVICSAIPAKETNEIRIKFNDQHYGLIQWEDASQNKALAGDVFTFWDCASNIFTFHKVHFVIQTSGRNILGLSNSYMSLTYDEMVAYGAKPRNGTYYPKSGFEPNSELMRLIN